VQLDGRAGELGGTAGATAHGLDRDRPQGGGIGVEAEDDLAAPLLDEGGQPVGEGSDASGGLAEGA
jgi:hypothetical protein